MFAFRPQPALTSPGIAALGVGGRGQVRPAVLAQRRAGGFWFGRRASAAQAVPALTPVVAARAPEDWDQLDPDQRVRLLGEW